MRISKTLFKNLMRCPNFASILDMYLNRAAHSVRIMDDTNTSDIYQQLPETSDDLFKEQSDDLMDIFEHLFDEETGEDLTCVTSAQLEAFADTFVEVERLAIEQAKMMFGENITASTNTYDQKSFSFSENGHSFYCYLDGYQENPDVIRVFEVKATTSKKYDEFELSIRKSKNCSGKKLPLFKENDKHILEYIGDQYLNQQIEQLIITNDLIDEKKKALLTPYSDEGKYIYDIAIESYIIKKALLQKGISDNIKIEYYLVVLNAEYIYDGYRENDKPNYHPDKCGHYLFKFIDVSLLVNELYPSVAKKEHDIIKYLDELTLCKNRLSIACEYKKTTECKFHNVCFRDVNKEGSILEFIRKQNAFYSIDEFNDKGKRKGISLYEMINNKHYLISDCEKYLLKTDNIIQYDCYVNKNTYVDKTRILKCLEQITYPIYHLDFESYNCPLPRFFGEKPYSQSLFQYSLHKEVSPGVCDIVKNHTEYLAPDHQDHREDLIQSLIKDIDLSNGGTVLVYNQNFEKTRLKELAYIFPKYKKELDNINNHIFDLLFVLKGNKKLYEEILSKEEQESLKIEPSFAYYDSALHGSFSIKKVLPIFTNLTYKTLEVQNGTEAILTYGLLDTLTKEEYEKKYLALRVYCRQDTWAMVEILRGLRKAI